MADNASITYQDVATILALIDGPQEGKLFFAQGDLEIHVEKTIVEHAMINSLVSSENT
tara:strand:+ start:2352 stop:2525 length:174 start_codon:yes stop_codon:yes gene_type:complete